MRYLLFLSLLVTSLFPFLSAPVAAQAASCSFVLGFAALDNLIPGIVGTCLVDEHHNPANGDGLQETTGGLLVWRKADNWTAFTDGYHTWINGPKGLQERLNSQRFPWEADYQANQNGSSSSGSTATPVPVTFISVVGAAPGGTASATIQTAPGASCRIDYFGPDQHDRYEDGALHPQTADANGNVTWSWVISRDTPLGTGTMNVTCNGVTASSTIAIGAPTPISIAFTSVVGAAPGGMASVAVQTTPSVWCSIDFFGPRGHDRFANGALHPKQSDANGNVSWSWPLPGNIPTGNGVVTVSCQGTSATTSIPIS